MRMGIHAYHLHSHQCDQDTYFHRASKAYIAHAQSKTISDKNASAPGLSSRFSETFTYLSVGSNFPNNKVPSR